MAKRKRRAPVGERKRRVVRVAQGHPVPARTPDGTLMRPPRIYKRQGSDEYRMTFVVANRRYYGHTGHADVEQAEAWAQQTFDAAVADWKERRTLARAYCNAPRDPATLLGGTGSHNLRMTSQVYTHVTVEDVAKALKLYRERYSNETGEDR